MVGTLPRVGEGAADWCPALLGRVADGLAGFHVGLGIALNPTCPHELLPLMPYPYGERSATVAPEVSPRGGTER
jgi:hypothetical protein